MKNLFKIATVFTVGALLVTGAFAQGKGAKKMAKAVDCPVCKMPLAMKKSKTNPVAVRLKKGGPVMYCCAACKMPMAVLVKPRAKMTHKPMMKKATMKKK